MEYICKIIKTYNDRSFDEMKATTITESMCDIEALTDERKSTDLENHLNNLKYKSLGESELCFYHNTLIILMRRKYKIDKTFETRSLPKTLVSGKSMSPFSLQRLSERRIRR